MTHLSYLDLLPEDLIGELYTYLQTESKKLVGFGELFKRVYNKMVKNITDGNIIPKKYFSTSISLLLSDMDLHPITHTIYRALNYIEKDNYQKTIDMNILMNSCIYLYGLYRPINNLSYKCINCSLYIYKIKYIGKNINDLITNKEYYVIRHYYTNRAGIYMYVDISDSWKYMWNHIMSTSDRVTIKFEYLITDENDY